MKPDPMEEKMASALTAAQIEYVTDTDPRSLDLDFYLPAQNVHIEVKQFHSDRIAAQMARAENVIALQGRKAVGLFCALLHRKK